MPRVSASVIAVICLVGLTQALKLHSAMFNSDPKNNWAVLVAGSNGWWNYRHQLYARQLNETITYMYENWRYQQMVFYIEACHSGSMFDDILSPNIQVYATTAANLMIHDIHKMTLDQQFNNVKTATIRSHVMKYGDTSMGTLTVDKFQAHGVTESMPISHKMHAKTADRKPSSRAHLAGLMRSLMGATTEDEHESAKRRLHRATQMGTIVEHTFDDIITEVEKRYKPSGNQMDKLEQLKCFETVFEVFKRHCFTIQQVPEVAQRVSKLH
ncbi:hypothetical protein PHET_07643 [Paragonimus heterotremus]|uniref:Legumain n=1 Tax=Paragonimus heterotremus TaxID=100268 RepID=A0A8J4WGF7_9TREM|nr:hypothetical protein PHET_07643 [Paragonimus heterotremus]